MTTTLPSRAVLAVDVPEVRNFRANFTYNFFTRDERVNDDGSVPESIARKKLSSFDSSFIDRLEDVTPRFVRLDFSSVVLDNTGLLTRRLNPSRTFSRRSRPNDFIESNIDKIHSEEQFANASFTGLQFQDTGADGKFYMLMSGSLAKRINSRNLETARAINDQIERIGAAIDTDRVSLLDVSKFLNTETDTDIEDKFVIRALNRLQSLGARFIDEDKATEIIEDSFERIKRVKTRIRINNKLLNTALVTSAIDPLGIFADEVGPMLGQAQSIQDGEVSESQPQNIDAAEYDITVDAVESRVIPSNTVFTPTREIVGYIIDKFERLADGTLEPRDPIIIETDAIGSSVDFKVAYGTIYVYQIRAIAQLEFETMDPETDDRVSSTVLVSSSPSPRMVVECIENVPPPPPADFDVSWDPVARAARLMWSFPVNRQRDIKKFQIFRRRTTSDPFELQAEFDFDDSAVKTQSFETPNINLIENQLNPRTFYLDREFKKDSRFIYAVVSIDAHGMSSNYSMQYEVTFDRFKNSLVKSMISNSGAPKPYPNMYLREDTFVDVIRDSGHSRVRVYFDPEYLSVFHGRNTDRDLGLIATDQTGGKYQLQFINIDLQKRQGIDIVVSDKRTSENKDKSPNKTTFLK